MSKSNADFSAFDFNDESSESSDVGQARGSYLNRTNLASHSSANNSNHSTEHNNNNSTNNNNSNNNNNNNNNSSINENNNVNINNLNTNTSSNSSMSEASQNGNETPNNMNGPTNTNANADADADTGRHHCHSSEADENSASEALDDNNDDNCSRNSDAMPNDSTTASKTAHNINEANASQSSSGGPKANSARDSDMLASQRDANAHQGNNVKNLDAMSADGNDGNGDNDEEDDDDDDDEEDDDGENTNTNAAAATVAATVHAVKNRLLEQCNSVGNPANSIDNGTVASLLDGSQGPQGMGGCSNSSAMHCADSIRSNGSNASFSNSMKMMNSAGNSQTMPGGGGLMNSASNSAANDRKKYRHQNYSKNIYIGTKNAEKWEHTRTRLQFKNDVEFVAYLLTLADKDTDRLANLPPPSAPATPTKSFAGNFKLEPNLSVKEFSQSESNETQPARKKSKKRVQFSDTLNGFPKIKDFANYTTKAKKHEQKLKAAAAGAAGSNSSNNSNANRDTLLPEVLDCRIAEKIKSELEEKSASALPTNALCLKKSESFDQGSDDEDGDEENDNLAAGVSGNAAVAAAAAAAAAGLSGITDAIDSLNGGGQGNNNKNNNGFRGVRVKTKKSLKAPFTPNAVDEEDDGDDTDDDDDEMDEEALAREMKNEQNFVEEEDEHEMAFRSLQSCRECSITHEFKLCPVRNAICIITDAVDLAEWIERKNLEALAKLKADAQRQAKQAHVDDEDMDETSQMSELETKPLITFAEASVPAEFELHNVEPNVTGVFVRSEVRAFTKLGPLIGQPVQTNDVREGSDMKWIFEVREPGDEKSLLLSCDNPNTSNWLRYIRPAPTYDERNVTLVSIDRQAYFVTCRDVKNGMELLYWSDDCNTMWRKKQNDKTNCGGCNLKFEHPLFYRTHCSIFHDPSMSLTIRKYHCKVCGDAILGKDNIMKHAAEVHDGKGAYQCQFCNKFFLRLNYLEVHRTYGCAANPNRARPLCDFCGRKFCQPQKLKAHIKRMHSGSRAALQRHSKEVHSRNSTVVSCPRCQKLFQNRSNLKIHMLTHSGVRPFKCAEPECNAAFTTKQCLQFHYKKVHNYTQEQMPKIERSVAYTFDAYSGGMKVDFLEQAPRRRRKSLEDQNSMLSGSIQSDTEMSDDNIFEAIKKSGKSIKDLCRNEPNLSLLSSKISNMFGEKVVGSRKRKKKKDPSTSAAVPYREDDDEEERLEQVRRKQNAQLSLVESFLTTTAQRLTAQQQVQQVVAAAAAVSAMASGNTEEAAKMHMMSAGLGAQHMAMGGGGAVHAVAGGMVNDDEEDDDDDDEDDERDGGSVGGGHHVHSVQQQQQQQQNQMDNNSYRHHSLGQNLVVSKGSKKWISGDDRHLSRDCASVDRCGAMSSSDVSGNNLTNNAAVCNMSVGGGAPNTSEMAGLPGFAVPPGSVEDQSKLIGQNRDFLARLMNSASANHNAHQNASNREEDENSSFLDVVESNNNGNSGQMQHYHHNNSAATATPNATSSGVANVGGGGGVGGVAGGLSNNSNNNNNESVQSNGPQMHMNPLTHPQSFMSSFYNNANPRLTGGTGSTPSTSASMLVEAALNSVGNIMDNESNDLKVPTENNINTDSPMSSHVDSESNRFPGSSANNPINNMDTLENELKMMKNLSNFPMQIPALPIFQNSSNAMSSCNISPSASTPTNPQSNQNNNDVDVDAGSTPRPQHMSNSAADSDAFSTTHHRTPPSPTPISPGRDYGGLFAANPATSNGTPGGPGTASSTSSGNSVGGGNNTANNNNNNNNNISATSPLPTIQAQRRNAPSVGSTYPEHELISPASSPSIPRYNFNGDVMRHKRLEHEAERRQNLPVASNHLSSDEENSIMPHNSAGQDMRMKFSQSQMDLMYSKYESMAKYGNQEIDSPNEYRHNNSNVSSGAAAAAAASATTSDMSDLQGLDMSSRSNLSASNYHHNFQLPSSAASSNLPGIGRYHHHIYDILSEREQSQQSQSQSQQQQHHSAAVAAAAAAAQHQQQQEHSSQLAMQQHHQSAMHNMLPDQLSDQDHDQATSVDLSRTANYVVSSPPQLSYNHPHHDMLRMASLDLTPNTNMSVGNNRSFLSSQMPHQSRESLEHHRLLSTVEQHRLLAASNAAAAADQHRLLVDPTAHLLMEQNNRLLGSDQSRLLGESAQNRHMARSFGAYHQVASGNYHPGVRPPVLPSANHHTSNPSNYHPFPAYY